MKSLALLDHFLNSIASVVNEQLVPLRKQPWKCATTFRREPAPVFDELFEHVPSHRTASWSFESVEHRPLCRALRLDRAGWHEAIEDRPIASALGRCATTAETITQFRGVRHRAGHFKSSIEWRWRLFC
jgi:hypothetical protein